MQQNKQWDNSVVKPTEKFILRDFCLEHQNTIEQNEGQNEEHETQKKSELCS